MTAHVLCGERAAVAAAGSALARDGARRPPRTRAELRRRRADDATERGAERALRSVAGRGGELKDRGIRVNVVSPAWIETPGGTAAFGDEETARAVKRNVAATVPKGRMGQPEEAAAVVAFLASEESSYVVGANLYADGGENQV